MRKRATFRFNIAPSSGVPIYRQIIDQIMAELAGGRLQPGDLLPSVRETAAQLQINPMTVSKAYSRLESLGVVELERGRGMRVCPPASPGSVKERQAQLRPLAEQIVSRAYQLGLNKEQVKSILDPMLEGLEREQLRGSGTERS